jgi:late competence protein required for DNA uptake (superfamily II DNA/RNA helicase)
MKQKIEVVSANVLKFEKGSKYLLILPVIRNAEEVTAALQRFLGTETQVFVIAAKDVNAVKIAELIGGGT